MFSNAFNDPFLSDQFFSDPFLYGFGGLPHQQRHRLGGQRPQQQQLQQQQQQSGGQQSQGGSGGSAGQQTSGQLTTTGTGLGDIGAHWPLGSSGLLSLIPRSTDAGWLSFPDMLAEPVHVSVSESDKQFNLTVKPPEHIRSKDLSVEVNQNILTISGQRERHRSRKGHQRDEFVSFTRSMQLPDNADTEKVTAKYDDKGNLCIEVAKVEGMGAKHIPIQGSERHQQQLQQPQQQSQPQTQSQLTKGSDQPMQVDKETKTGAEPRAGHQIPIQQH